VITNGADPGTPRHLSETGVGAAKDVAQVIASQVDELLAARGIRRGSKEVADEGVERSSGVEEGVQEAVEAACSCGSGIPVLTMSVNGQRETLIAVPAIFDQLYEQGKRPSVDSVADELLQTTRLYNSIPDAEAAAYRAALLREFEVYCRKKEA
jgi:hypothetical protein